MKSHEPPVAQTGAIDSACQQPAGATAVLVLADGKVFWGMGLGAEGEAVAEVCFNTSMTGYQEILTDPSYAGQIITFTFPHIGNVGTNEQDIETITPSCRGAIFRVDITQPSNWRATRDLDTWLKSHNLSAISGIDTRVLTRLIRDGGAPNGCIAHHPDGKFDLEALRAKAAAWPGLNGMDLAREVTCSQTTKWDEQRWDLEAGYTALTDPEFHVVAVDFGAKRNILRSLASQGCRVTVVPAETTASEILAHKPDGVFLSNGPGDPAATGIYAIPMVQELLTHKELPIFGICLGHQILALALGAKTTKMHLGHRGANHPVKDFTTNKVEITSQNHGFMVDKTSLPANVEETHISLFDSTNQGIRLKDRPVFSVQYHPEASPGPQDSQYLFKRFRDLMAERRK
ncbi:glutamine-hydrolyzing carbamoyl-phosphate synthase small subunit [Kiloniella laminariae]|uniref:Carbamoyl phosphate synthase small chain n=1 Tax=Kiloniella laminariae TaxID=454162 RepID=A0ABT4LDQ9_9PROT|nr:glutamine-hydrolyzing carbamoyl-phosphate synthase small subunit [Kiloniella laminariae]MCZ4279239.1 glutamine-hydrolyzing carbamoyl-phosphate synthase small subunit [Kiloniella laminariae]